LCALLSLAILLSACGISSDVSGEDLVRTEWVLISLNGAAPIRGAAVTLNFFEDQLNGTTGCNMYNADYGVDGKMLSVSVTAITVQACLEPEGIMEQEAVYMELMRDVITFGIEKGQLRLETLDGRYLLFRK
jgi:heat shock protein HslJ